MDGRVCNSIPGRGRSASIDVQACAEFKNGTGSRADRLEREREREAMALNGIPDLKS